MGAIKVALDSFRVDYLKVEFTKGERNLPAERFFNSHLKDKYENVGKFSFELPTRLLKIAIE